MIFKKIKNLFQSSKENSLETDNDKKLKNNNIDNTEIRFTGITETDSGIVYIKNVDNLLKIGKTDIHKENIERELSCVKILIESTVTKYFLDSLDFFNKINHEDIEEILSNMFLFDTDNNPKIYLLISGSIGDYIKFIYNYMQNHGDTNNLIVGVIMKHMQEIPLHYNHYEVINKEYNLHLGYKEFNNYEENQVEYEPEFNSNLAKVLSGTIKSDSSIILLGTTMLKDGYNQDLVPKSWNKILELFIRKELELKKFNLIFYMNALSEQDVIIEHFHVYPICDKLHTVSFSKLFYQRGRFSDYNIQLIQSIQKNNADFLKENTFTYFNNSEDETDSLTMLDLVDEIIN